MYRRIRDLREDNDWKQEELAQRLHVNQATYSRYESGKIDVPTEVLRELALIYRTSTDYLLDMTDERRAYPRKNAKMRIPEKMRKTLDREAFCVTILRQSFPRLLRGEKPRWWLILKIVIGLMYNGMAPTSHNPERGEQDEGRNPS